MIGGSPSPAGGITSDLHGFIVLSRLASSFIRGVGVRGGKLKPVLEVRSAPHPQPFPRLQGKGACLFNVHRIETLFLPDQIGRKLIQGASLLAKIFDKFASKLAPCMIEFNEMLYRMLSKVLRFTGKAVRSRGG